LSDTSGESSRGREQLTESFVRATLDAAWWTSGYTSPNPDTYPWLWLWDSCFHAVIWAALDPERALSELRAVFDAQTPSGFVPHLSYMVEPQAALPLWGKPGSSTITQPPMYGHAIRLLQDRNIQVPDSLVVSAWNGLRHLVDVRMRGGGMLVVVHPWETGCDDSARFGTWQPDPFVKARWDVTKRTWLDTMVVVDGGAVANPSFEVESAMFNALVVFNARELAAVSNADEELMARIDQIEAAIARQWDSSASTWIDGDHESGAVPTLEALLPLLLAGGSEDVEPAWAAIEDDERFMAPWGPRQTARTHPTYDPDGYWRGPTWPQLNYLLWVAACRWGRSEIADRLRSLTVRGAVASGMSEYWNPETGQGRGARPQTWTCLAWVMQEEKE
jgi:hypothetical protein